MEEEVVAEVEEEVLEEEVPEEVVAEVEEGVLEEEVLEEEVADLLAEVVEEEDFKLKRWRALPFFPFVCLMYRKRIIIIPNVLANFQV